MAIVQYYLIFLLIFVGISNEKRNNLNLPIFVNSFEMRNSFMSRPISTRVDRSFLSSPTSFFNNYEKGLFMVTRLNVSNAKNCRQFRRSVLAMHMGHSHSSHQHDHDHHTHDGLTLKNHQADFKSFLASRTTISILFAALLVLTPRLLSSLPSKSIIHALMTKISLNNINFNNPTSQNSFKGDIGAFLLLSTLFTIADKIRDQAQIIIRKAQQWRLSMLKHATPLNKDYFFRNNNAADRVTFLGVIINLVLSGGKLLAGIVCHSSALIADAGHSLSDLFSDFVTLWAVQVARLPPDDDHPYGHGKFESVGSLFLSLALLGTGMSVGLSSYLQFVQVITLQRNGVEAVTALVQLPTWPALIVAAISIVSKEWLYRVTYQVGERLNSQVVIANAWHHRSDAYSSVLAFFSIGMAMAVPGFLAVDSAAGMLVAGMIAMTGAEIMGESMKQLTDAVTDEGMVKRVEYIASEDADVKSVRRVRARQVGSQALVEVEVITLPDLSASAMRAIEERIRVRIFTEVTGVLDVVVRAIGEDVVFCPLLTAIEDTDLDHKVSATKVEEAARLMLEAHPDVISVGGVTVHYHDTVLVRVDANISVDPNKTVSEAHALAATLRQILESDEGNNVDQANIFLDLNVGLSGDNSRERVLIP